MDEGIFEWLTVNNTESLMMFWPSSLTWSLDRHRKLQRALCIPLQVSLVTGIR